MRKIVIFGKNGQLGKEFAKRLSDKNPVLLDIDDLDITDTLKVLDFVKHTGPELIINCTAYNFVDKAETDFISAFKTNALGVRNLALAAEKYKAKLVHFGSDYVFDGKKEGLYTEEDTPNPVNEYGKSKLAGEVFLSEICEDALIFRVSWLYGRGEQNFIHKLVSWANNNSTLKIAYDEISVPTSAITVADITLKALEKNLTGLYHLTNSGYASRYEWAREIFTIKKIDKFIYPVSGEIFNLPAKRPNFSAMSNGRLSEYFEIPHWKDALNRFISES